jgi:hypothetical protein
VSSHDTSLGTELQEQIRAFREEMLPKFPKDVLATLMKSIEDLVRSGIAEGGLREGAKAPDFALPNARGETVRLSELLARGPAVVTFYRGTW